MKSITANQIENNGPASDGHASFAIRFLDPGLKRRQRQFATVFAVLAALIVWATLFGLLFFHI